MIQTMHRDGLLARDDSRMRFNRALVRLSVTGEWYARTLYTESFTRRAST